MHNTALITGASSGIGAAIALGLAKQGYHIAVGCHSSSSVERGGRVVAESCRKLGVSAECFVADVSDFSGCVFLVKEVAERFGGIDVLVNCAGVTRDGPIARMSEEHFDEVLNVNLKGAFNTIRHVTPLMMKRRGGAIVNISSVVGLTGNRGQANYAASKAGLIGLTKSVARELGSRGITCNAVAPGYIETAMTDAMPEKAKEAILSTIVLGRPGTPEEVADAVVFLVKNRYVTGQVLVVDGGMAI